MHKCSGLSPCTTCGKPLPRSLTWCILTRCWEDICENWDNIEVGVSENPKKRRQQRREAMRETGLLSQAVGTKAMHLQQTMGFISPHCCWQNCLQLISNTRLSFKIRNKLNPLNEDTKAHTLSMLQSYGLLEVPVLLEELGLHHHRERWQGAHLQ